MIHHTHEYILINIPKAHKHRRDVRKVTQSHLDAHLPTHIGEICVGYLYLPTFPGMSCFETCGILRAPMIGCIASYFTLMRGFHNARCPWFPNQCITCNPTVVESYQCLRSQSPSATDQPFMIHDRKAMAQFAITHEPSHNKLFLLFGVSCITFLGLNYVAMGTPECPHLICALAGPIIIALCDMIQNIRIENM